MLRSILSPSCTLHVSSFLPFPAPQVPGTTSSWTVYSPPAYIALAIPVVVPHSSLLVEGRQGRTTVGDISRERERVFLSYSLVDSVYLHRAARAELYKYAPLYTGRSCSLARRNTENRIDTENESRRVHTHPHAPLRCLSLVSFSLSLSLPTARYFFRVVYTH